MAALINISYKAWQGYEAGDNVPGGNVLKSLSKLGFNTNWILTGEGNMMQYGMTPYTRGEGYEAEEVREQNQQGDDGNQASIQNLIRDLMDIMDSDDAGTKLAITQNIKMFKESVKRKQRLDRGVVDTDLKLKAG